MFNWFYKQITKMSQPQSQPQVQPQTQMILRKRKPTKADDDLSPRIEENLLTEGQLPQTPKVSKDSNTSVTSDNPEVTDSLQNTDPQQPLDSIPGKEQGDNKEVPLVVDMKDFEEVDMSDKLNLLMAAINTINSNFYCKMEEVKTDLSAKVAGLTPRMTALEKTCEELHARMDDIESNYVTNQEMIQRMNKLDAVNAALKDDVAMLKGLVQVQDKQI